jgi:HEAT repeat protein
MARPTPLLLTALLLAAACSGPGTSEGDPEKPPIPVQPEPDPMGKLLSDLDLRIRAWSSLTMTAGTERERRQARELQFIIEREATQRCEELVLELETGPPRNRQRAAAALGFTGDERALAPLLGALEDPHPAVVSNALLGLALLARPETPTSAIAALMTEGDDGATRSNAAYALRSVVEAGGDPQPTVGSVRLALHDSEPGVRVQAALLAGLGADGESVQRLADLIHDDEPLVQQAAIEGLVLLGKRSGPDKGAAARALVDAWVDADRSLRNPLRDGMARLADRDYGSEEERWLEWSRNLP